MQIKLYLERKHLLTDFGALLLNVFMNLTLPYIFKVSVLDVELAMKLFTKRVPTSLPP
jgi:hypothetical protein